MVIISHQHKFIYIKTRKTASTSIQVMLEQFCGPDDIVTPLFNATTEEGTDYNRRARNYKGILSIIKILKYQIIILLKSKRRLKYLQTLITFYFKLLNKNQLRIFLNRFVSHASAEKVRLKVGPLIWNEYFKFSFERNPWDKVISFYYHRNPAIPFIDWINTLSLNLRSQPINFPLYSISGKVELDFIGTYENLYKDLKYIFKVLKLPFKELPLERISYRKNKDNYRSYYNEKTKKIVEKYYKKEIALFKYSF